RDLVAAVRARGGFVILDEIYLGLYYDEPPLSGLTLDDDLVVINSFSKYFHMTGWRLGWLIAPQAMMPALERLAASLAICAPPLRPPRAQGLPRPDDAIADRPPPRRCRPRPPRPPAPARRRPPAPPAAAPAAFLFLPCVPHGGMKLTFLPRDAEGALALKGI